VEYRLQKQTFENLFEKARENDSENRHHHYDKAAEAMEFFTGGAITCRCFTGTE
jgi:hypothetical protein